MYIKGEDNVVANAMSHLPDELTTDTPLPTVLLQEFSPSLQITLYCTQLRRDINLTLSASNSVTPQTASLLYGLWMALCILGII